MDNPDFQKVIAEICARDPRYAPESYYFLREVLEFTAKTLNKSGDAILKRQVTGHELLGGLRTYALQEFGPMAITVLHAWGIRRTEDFGEIVFNMVDAGWLRKTETDRKEDFADGYDFDETFARPFRPSAPRRAPDKKNAKPSPRRTGSKGKKSNELL